jgi:phospholipid/cholesterol/gamma-HCH transport system ATP-binding protein
MSMTSILPLRDPGDPVVECRRIRKSFGAQTVLDEVNARFPADAISALVGPSGTGKTTLMRIILGVIMPDSGDVLVQGKSVPGMTEPELLAMRLGLGVLLEGPRALFSSLTVFENVAFPLRQSRRVGEEEIRATVLARLDEVGLGMHADKNPEEMSMGMRVRAAFARAVVLRPETLICDSPDYGMDPVRAALLYELVKEMRGDYLKSVILITHDLPSVFTLADHVVVMHQGHVIEEGSREQVAASENPFTRQFIAGDTSGPLGMA